LLFDTPGGFLHLVQPQDGKGIGEKCHACEQEAKVRTGSERHSTIPLADSGDHYRDGTATFPKRNPPGVPERLPIKYTTMRSIVVGADVLDLYNRVSWGPTVVVTR
jgi:hypothetical protein